jgi:hypothetical protein
MDPAHGARAGAIAARPLDGGGQPRARVTTTVDGFGLPGVPVPAVRLPAGHQLE